MSKIANSACYARVGEHFPPLSLSSPAGGSTLSWGLVNLSYNRLCDLIRLATDPVPGKLASNFAFPLRAERRMNVAGCVEAFCVRMNEKELPFLLWRKERSLSFFRFVRSESLRSRARDSVIGEHNGDGVCMTDESFETAHFRVRFVQWPKHCETYDINATRPIRVRYPSLWRTLQLRGSNAVAVKTLSYGFRKVPCALEEKQSA